MNDEPFEISTVFELFCSLTLLEKRAKEFSVTDIQKNIGS